MLVSSKTEQTQNPNAVLNALKVLEKSVKRTDHNKYMGTNSIGEIIDEEDDEGSEKSRDSVVMELPTSPSEVQKPADDEWEAWTPTEEEAAPKAIKVSLTFGPP